MRTIASALPALIFCASCAGVIVAPSNPPSAGQAERPIPAAPAVLPVPQRLLPSPGACRLWFPGRPAALQPLPGRCSLLKRHLAPGSWLLQRPKRKPEEIRVSFCDERRPRVVVAVRVYEAGSGRHVGDRSP